MIQAEVRRLARALAPYRVLQRDALRLTAGEAAKINPVPAGFYAGAEPASEPTS